MSTLLVNLLHPNAGDFSVDEPDFTDDLSNASTSQSQAKESDRPPIVEFDGNEIVDDFSDDAGHGKFYVF